MFEWLIDSILGNGYLKAAAIFVLFYTLSEIAVVIFEKVFLRLAKKTKTDLDDIIVKNLKRPISFLLLSLGFKLAFVSIGLEGRWDTILNGITSTLVVVTVIYIIKTVIEVLVLHWGVKFASKTESTMDDNLVNLAQKALGVGFIVVSFLFVLKVWGVEIAPLLAGLGVGGIAIAFALQKSLGNVFGGISLILDKSITVGDTVVIDETTKGTILDIGLRSTKIRTFDNEVIIVPNAMLAQSKIQNIGHNPHA